MEHFEHKSATHAYRNGVVVLEVISDMMRFQSGDCFASGHNIVVKGPRCVNIQTYRRFELKHISMHVLFLNTILFACSSKKVACPSRSGEYESS